MAQWTTEVQGLGWKGYWIPFQERTLEKKSPTIPTIAAEDKEPVDISKVKLGQGSDLVIFYTHGGGYMDGCALQSMHFLLKVMNRAFSVHKIKVSILTIEYSRLKREPKLATTIFSPLQTYPLQTYSHACFS